MLVDTHAHLYWESFKKDLDKVIKRSIEAGVTTIINVGVDIEKSKEALKQAQRLNKIYGEPSRTITFYSTVGIHPHESIKYLDAVSIHKDIEKLEELYQSAPSQIVAVGECGLDYVFSTSEESKPTSEVFMQKQLFQAQIDLAKKLNLPLVVHCRDDRSQGSGSTGSPPTETSSPSAWDQTLKMIGNHPAILHCYSGLLPTTNYVLRTTNLLVSFAATITYPKNEYLRETAKFIPLERIVLETDCPFLPPQLKRGQRNEPASVLEIAQLIADLKGISLEEVATQTTANVVRLFAL